MLCLNIKRFNEQHIQWSPRAIIVSTKSLKRFITSPHLHQHQSDKHQHSLALVLLNKGSQRSLPSLDYKKILRHFLPHEQEKLHFLTLSHCGLWPQLSTFRRFNKFCSQSFLSSMPNNSVVRNYHFWAVRTQISPSGY